MGTSLRRLIATIMNNLLKRMSLKRRRERSVLTPLVRVSSHSPVTASPQNRKEAELSPREAQKAIFQQKLEDEWECKDKKNCPSRFCYVLPEHDNLHIPLNFREFEVWTEAMVRLGGYLDSCALTHSQDKGATDEKAPPNTWHFDPDPNKRSSLMTARMAASSKKEEPNGGQHVVHIHNYYGAPGADGAQAPAAQTPRPQAPASSRPARSEGPPMTLDDFSLTYRLSPSTTAKLAKIAIRNVSTLAYLDMEKLSEKAGLEYGEYGELLEARLKWAEDV